jgi:23S rRNA (guanine745-N1)-methyltransferase
VAPPLPRPGHRLLRCPICRLRLDARAGAIACLNRHNFDLAREGYVSLLTGSRRRPADGGDHPKQLRHRKVFLDAGHFDFITTEIAERLWHAGAMSAVSSLRVLDAGCGTGHHLASIAKALSPGTAILGLDISATAARMAARHCPDIAFAVADLWADWPLHDASIDLVLSIFAPRNFVETARVLRPGGWLALVYPETDHLIELRRRYRLLGHQSEKTTRYSEAVSRTIGLAAVTRIVRRAVLAPDAVHDIVLMGPNARHPAGETVLAEAEPVAVTFDIAILLARKRGPLPAQNSSRRGKGWQRFPAP